MASPGFGQPGIGGATRWRPDQRISRGTRSAFGARRAGSARGVRPCGRCEEWKCSAESRRLRMARAAPPGSAPVAIPDGSTAPRLQRSMIDLRIGWLSAGCAAWMRRPHREDRAIDLLVQGTPVARPQNRDLARGPRWAGTAVVKSTSPSHHHRNEKPPQESHRPGVGVRRPIPLCFPGRSGTVRLGTCGCAHDVSSDQTCSTSVEL